jgi:hypothetical protein
MFNIRKNNLLSIALRYLFVALVLGIIFTAYFAPETMVAITNQVWAMCGW